MEVHENVSLLPVLPRCLYITEPPSFRQPTPLCVISLILWTLALSRFLFYPGAPLSLFLTSGTKAGTVRCLNGAHLPDLTDASGAPLSKQKPLNAASVSMVVTYSVKGFSSDVWAKRWLNADGRFSQEAPF